MGTLVWDKPEDRTFESGLDRGVLYLPDGSAVAWNGLSSVIEKFDKSTIPVYFDGMKIRDFVVLGDFSATMKAVTYPDEFVELEGLGELRRGMFVGDQEPQVFGLCYRTKTGNAVSGEDAGYKIHVLFNVTAIPSDKTYASISNDPSLVEFEWTLTAVPEEVPGFRPTAHFILDSRKFDPYLLMDLEDMLYGSSSADAVLLPMSELVAFISEWYRVKIFDNGDGTWTAVSERPEFINFTDPDEVLFQIIAVNAVYLDDVTYQISDTVEFADVPQIKINDSGDGIWTATTDYEGLIVTTAPGVVNIYNANINVLDADTYEISDTTE